MKGLKFLGFAIVIAVWFIVTASGLVGSLFLPSPVSVLRELYELVMSGEMFLHLFCTLYRVFVAFLLGVVIGIPLGLQMGYFVRFNAAIGPIIHFFRSIPVFALFPLFLILFGLGDVSKICTAAWATSFVILINSMGGVSDCKKLRELVARTMNASRWQILSRIILPGAVPHIVDGMRVGLSWALIVVVVTEMFMGTEMGLGLQIYNAFLLYHVPEMYALICVIGLLGYVLHGFFDLLKKRFVHWEGR